VLSPQGLWPGIRKTYDKYLGPEPPALPSPDEAALARAVEETPEIQRGGGLS